MKEIDILITLWDPLVGRAFKMDRPTRLTNRPSILVWAGPLKNMKKLPYMLRPVHKTCLLHRSVWAGPQGLELGPLKIPKKKRVYETKCSRYLAQKLFTYNLFCYLFWIVWPVIILLCKTEFYCLKCYTLLIVINTLYFCMDIFVLFIPNICVFNRCFYKSLN